MRGSVDFGWWVSALVFVVLAAVQARAWVIPLDELTEPWGVFEHDVWGTVTMTPALSHQSYTCKGSSTMSVNLHTLCPDSLRLMGCFTDFTKSVYRSCRVRLHVWKKLYNVFIETPEEAGPNRVSCAAVVHVLGKLCCTKWNRDLISWLLWKKVYLIQFSFIYKCKIITDVISRCFPYRTNSRPYDIFYRDSTIPTMSKHLVTSGKSVVYSFKKHSVYLF